MFDMLFSFLAFFKAYNFMKSRSRDGLAAKGLLAVTFVDSLPSHKDNHPSLSNCLTAFSNSTLTAYDSWKDTGF